MVSMAEAAAVAGQSASDDLDVFSSRTRGQVAHFCAQQIKKSRRQKHAGFDCTRRCRMRDEQCAMHVC